MALAVKNKTETTGPTLLARLPVASLVGAAYVVVSLAIAFWAVPYVCWNTLALSHDSFFAISLQAFLAIGVLIGLTYVGVTRLAPKQVPGVRSGIFVAIVGLALILMVTSWLGLILDSWFFNSQPFGESNAIGIVITVAVGGVMLFFASRAFFRPTFEDRLHTIEEQGWFNAIAYKKTQGMRVRRGTMAGILALVACGIYAMEIHHTLDIGSKDWNVGIPFSKAEIAVKSPGDTKLPTDKVDRLAFREANSSLRGWGKLETIGDSEVLQQYQPKDLVQESVLKEERSRMADLGKEEPKWSTPTPATAGATVFQSVPLLPDVKLTVPLLLAALSLWFAWRLVNYPAFADFLIATEAELNKVSWTTRKRLVQDTMVVLVTVVLMTVFLLVVDVVWGKLLASKWIGVLRVNPAEAKENAESEVPW